MLHYKKRGEKFVWYWENDSTFRKVVRETNGIRRYEIFYLSSDYNDLLFEEFEFQAIKTGLLSNSGNYEWKENVYFNQLGKKLCLNGGIQTLEKLITIDEVTNRTYVEIYNQKQNQKEKISDICSDGEFWFYYLGLRGEKSRNRNLYSQKSWILNFAAYERFLAGK
jgi:hypothetical protein